MLYLYFWSSVRVTITPESVQCVPVLGPTIVHRDRLIFLVHARVGLPGLGREGIEVIGERGDRGCLCGWQSTRVSAALVDAGFTVRERTRWILPAGGPPWVPRLAP
jgi:hypothetical protein